MCTTGDGNYIDEDSHHHHHHATVGQVPPSGSAESSIRQAVQFSGYPGQYPPHNSGGASVAPQLHDGMAPMNTHSSSNAIAAKAEQDSDNASLFGVVPEGKGRKFIVVHDDIRGGRVRVRVTLDTVNPKEIPDSYRKSNSVFPRSWFPIEMQSPPPSANGSRFFLDDDNADEDGASGDGPSSRGKTFVRVPLPDGTETSLAAPRIRKSQRMKEVKINELGYRMTWHQSRVFAGRTVFLQKALDCYRTRVAQVLEGPGGEGLSKVPHFETRVGKRRLGERRGRGKDT